MSNDLFRVLYGDRPELQENCCVYDVFGNSLSCSAASVAEFAKSIFTDHLWEHEPFQISSSKVLKNGGTEGMKRVEGEELNHMIESLNREVQPRSSVYGSVYGSVY